LRVRTEPGVRAHLGQSPATRAASPAFIVPTNSPGHNVLYNHWTFNMPSDHAETELKDVRVPTARSCTRKAKG
jgi:alkylation response protein AidB-like acyl-CoA dehydrogenase